MNDEEEGSTLREARTVVLLSIPGWIYLIGWAVLGNVLAWLLGMFALPFCVAAVGLAIRLTMRSQLRTRVSAVLWISSIGGLLGAIGGLAALGVLNNWH